MKSYEVSVGVMAEHILTIRKMKKQSQAAIARAAGVTAAYLCLLEKGKQRTVTNTVAKSIAEALAVKPEAVFVGYIEPVEDKEALLTEREREEYAERYLEKLRESVWYRRQYYNFDFEEAYSEGLVVFARALFTYKKTSNCSFPHYVEHALEGTFKSERRKMTREKRKGETLSLDNLLNFNGGHGGEKDFYSVHASSFNLEEHICIREECREAVEALTPERRRDPYIAELIACAGF